MAKIYRSIDDKVPLGLAVMLVRGAIDRLEKALEGKDPCRLVEERAYAYRVIEIYETAKRTTPQDSLIVRRYIRIGDSDVITLQAKQQTADSRLRSFLKCC